eukprot:TRINITY_DN5515_c0_g1_i2.p1 TRINITY_DN5515_c0_g1~~TRINITY_DN5515_c0_g1_i2.p1  ORF type:complete len:375 (-),score=72.16 TRINITY_DN5515_c0_g1_i2:1018-2142(-)
MKTLSSWLRRGTPTELPEKPYKEPLLRRDETRGELRTRARPVQCFGFGGAYLADYLKCAGTACTPVLDAPAQQQQDIKAGEGLHLCLVFWIGSIYMYGPLMLYPLYKELVRVKGDVEAPVTSVAACFFMGRLVAQAVHLVLLSVAERVWGCSLRSVQGVVAVMYATSALGLFVAADDRTSPHGVLIGVCSLNLVSSRVLGGVLFTVPLEDMIKTRGFVYDVGCVAGCLWTAVVTALINAEACRVSPALRFLALLLPLAFCFIGWLFVSPDKYFNAARMADAQRQMSKAPSVASDVETCSTTTGSAASPEDDSSSSPDAESGQVRELDEGSCADGSAELPAETNSEVRSATTDSEASRISARYNIIAAAWCLSWL